jgi:hypothetical protein
VGMGMFILGLVVGYVLGTRAGHERYEQIKEHATDAGKSPRVQGNIDAAKRTAKSAAGSATQQVRKRVPGSGFNASQTESRGRPKRCSGPTRPVALKACARRRGRRGATWLNSPKGARTPLSLLDKLALGQPQPDAEGQGRGTL